jgi:Flp pilus assembly protein TadB
MSETLQMAVISALISVITVIIAWQLTGHWAFLSSRTQSRLHEAETPVLKEDLLSRLPAGSLARKLSESGWPMSVTQFRLASIGIGLAGMLLAWRFFLPGLPAVMIGGMLAFLPTLMLN